VTLDSRERAHAHAVPSSCAALVVESMVTEYESMESPCAIWRKNSIDCITERSDVIAAGGTPIVGHPNWQSNAQSDHSIVLGGHLQSPPKLVPVRKYCRSISYSKQHW
jgi:hypothetical protein